MKFRILPPLYAVLTLLLISLIAPHTFAQRSAAELIHRLSPASGEIRFNDGVRQVLVHDQYLFVTNFWAGFQVVDISEVANPRPVAFLRSPEQAYGVFIEGDYAYLANEQSGVMVYDISRLPAVTPVAHIETPGNVYWVAAEYPYLFLALGYEGFAIMDVSDWNNPVTVRLEIAGPWIHHLEKKGNLLYLAAKKDGLLIYDISNFELPTRLAQLRTGFNTMKVQVVDDLAYLADGPGGLVIVDVENPRFPRQLSRFWEVGFVGDLHKVGNYVYLANREVGLEIVNISDPRNPFLENRYPTTDKAYGVYKQDVYVFLAANTATLILRHNNAPVLEPVSDFRLRENTPFSYQLQASEPDGDPIVFEALNLPEGAEFDPQTGEFRWTPTYEQSGTYSNVVFRVIEQTLSHLSAGDTVSIFVEHVNRLPDLPPLEDVTVDENSPLTITLPEGSDPDREDQHRLTYRAEALPPGATFDPATRTFSWTPTYEQSGIYQVDFLIDDGNGGIDREPVTITVRHVDRKPVIDAIVDQSIDEGSTLTLTLTGTEPDREDQDKISFAMENLPEGAAFDPATRTLTWTPTYDQSGVYPHIRAIMRAGNLSDTTEFSITVNHVNRPPVLAQIPPQSVNENEPLSFVVEGSDPDVEDAGKLRFTAEMLPEGAAFDPATRTFTWTPTFEQSGTYEVTFTVADPAGFAHEQTVSITVHHVNRPPQIAQVPPQTVNENELLRFRLSADDPDREDAGKLRFSAGNLPEGSTLNEQTGEFQWQPSYEQSGEYAVVFLVTDGQYRDSTTAQITVVHVNRPPQLAALTPMTVDENQLLSFVVEGEDPDREDAGKLEFAARNLPRGAEFDPATRTFRWTPTYEQSGEYPVTFTVQDPGGLTAEQTVTITVRHVNRPPQLAAVEPAVVDENQPLSLQFVGSDPDQEDTGKLRYQLIDAPPGAQIDPATGAFSWTPTFEQSGEYTFTVQVQDPGGLTAEQTVSVTVNHVNRPPVLAAVAPISGKENQPVQFTLQADDPDAEDAGKLTFSAAQLPEGATLDPATGQFSWTPTYEQSGEYTLSFQVTDGAGAGAQTDVTLSIAHVNRPPVLPPVAGVTLKENEPGEITLPEGSDPDREDQGKLTYRVEGLPTGATFDPATRLLRWTPTFDQAGEYTLTAVVEDGGGLTASQPLRVRVENVNRPPTLAPLAAQQGEENRPIRFQLAASDPDREDQGKLTFSAESLPEGAALNPSTGEFTWTPTYEQSGEYTLTFAVTDGYGAQATLPVTVTVAHVNRPPVLPEVSRLRFTENVSGQFSLPPAEDPDAEDAGKLTYRVENLPAGAVFDPATREVRWKPGFDQAGEYTFTYIADDGQAEARQPVSVVVENTNRPPEIESPGDQVVKVGQELKFSLTVGDPDPEDASALRVEARNLPPGARFDPESNVFIWTPTDSQPGLYHVEFVVKDSGDLSDTVTVTIRVEEVSGSPQTP